MAALRGRRNLLLATALAVVSAGCLAVLAAAPVSASESATRTLVLKTKPGREQLSLGNTNLFIAGKEGSHTALARLTQKFGAPICEPTNASGAPHLYDSPDGPATHFEVRWRAARGANWGFWGRRDGTDCASIIALDGVSLTSRQWTLKTSLGSLRVGRRWASAPPALRRFARFDSLFGAYVARYPDRGCGRSVEFQVHVRKGVIESISVAAPTPCDIAGDAIVTLFPKSASANSKRYHVLSGTCKKTLLRYNSKKDKVSACLAKKAVFTGPKAYAIMVRKGVRWSDGRTITGKDVAFNLRLGRLPNASWHDLYLNLRSINVDGMTIRIRFKQIPNYSQWQQLICELPIVDPRIPRNTFLPTISGVASQGQTLYASPGSWTQSPDYSYQWRRCDSSGAMCSDISGANSEFYELVDVDVAHTTRVVVTASNFSGSAHAVSEQTAVVAGLPPESGPPPTS